MIEDDSLKQSIQSFERILSGQFSPLASAPAHAIFGPHPLRSHALLMLPLFANYKL